MGLGFGQRWGMRERAPAGKGEDKEEAGHHRGLIHISRAATRIAVRRRGDGIGAVLTRGAKNHKCFC